MLLFWPKKKIPLARPPALKKGYARKAPSPQVALGTWHKSRSMSGDMNLSFVIHFTARAIRLIYYVQIY